MAHFGLCFCLYPSSMLYRGSRPRPSRVYDTLGSQFPSLLINDSPGAIIGSKKIIETSRGRIPRRVNPPRSVAYPGESIPPGGSNTQASQSPQECRVPRRVHPPRRVAYPDEGRVPCSKSGESISLFCFHFVYEEKESDEK